MASAHFPKFVLRRSTHLSRTSEGRGHSQIYICSAAFHLTFLVEFAASGAGTSNGRPSGGFASKDSLTSNQIST